MRRANVAYEALLGKNRPSADAIFALIPARRFLTTRDPLAPYRQAMSYQDDRPPGQLIDVRA
jgi:hypothetical protein